MDQTRLAVNAHMMYFVLHILSSFETGSLALSHNEIESSLFKFAGPSAQGCNFDDPSILGMSLLLILSIRQCYRVTNTPSLTALYMRA